MKRYQKLIQDSVADPDVPDNQLSHSPRKARGYHQLARAMEVPATSIHEWATFSYKVPQYKSLEKIAAYFNVPLSTLLMEHDDPLVPVLDKLFTSQPQAVAVVKSFLACGDDKITLELVKLFLQMNPDEKDTLRGALKKIKLIR